MPIATLRLETLGGLSLTGAGGSTLVSQRRRLALLAVLAASADRGATRDQLHAYFSADSAPDAARHALEQALYSIRRALGESVFIGVNPLRLDPAVVSSDVADFEAALATGALADAVALYRGPFLDGFYLTNAPEFERWVESQRGRLAARYARALEQLAVDAEAGGDRAGAVRWRRRAADADPLSGRGALALMRALVSSGDMTAAFQHARVYEALVRQELETAPDAEIVAYLESLRAARPATAPHEVRTSGPPTPVALAVPSIERATVPRSRRALTAVVLVAPLVLATSWVAWRARTVPGGTPPPGAATIFVAPFRVSGVDSTLRGLGEGMVDLLSAKLAGDGVPRAIDAGTSVSTWRGIATDENATTDAALRAARGVGAGQLMLGTVVGTDRGRLTIEARLLSAGDGRRIASTVVEGPRDSLGLLVDRLAARLLALAGGVAEQHLGSLTTSSFPALLAYLAGNAAYRRGEEAAAIDHFDRALRFDSTFALAALELASATGRALATGPRENAPGEVATAALDRRQGAMSDYERFDRAMTIAGIGSSRLSARDRAWFLALGGGDWRRGASAAEVLRRWELASAAAPDRAEAHYRVGYLLLYQGPALGLSDSRARAASEFRRAFALDSTFVPPLAGLVDVAAFVGDTLELRRQGARYLAHDARGPIAGYVRWLVAAATRDEGALERLRATMDSLDTVALDRIQLTSQLTGLALDDADRAMRLVIGRSSETLSRRFALWSAYWLALNRGRPHDATRLLRSKRELEGNDVLLWHFSVLGTLFADGDSTAAVVAVRGLSRHVDPWLGKRQWSTTERAKLIKPTERATLRQPLFLLTLWRLSHGDSTGAATAIHLLRDAGDNRDIVLGAMLADLLRRADADTLRARLDSLAQLGCCAPTRWVGLVLARLHERAGDDAAALRALRRGRWFFPPWFLSTYLREEGRLAARTGDRAGAIRAYRHYLALRASPEPALRAAVDSVRTELTTLEAAS